jgi:hypothetical protein
MSIPQDSDGVPAETWRSQLKVAAIVLAVLFGLTAIALVIVDAAGRSAVRAQLAALKAAGEPLTLAEFEARRPEIADEENSALVIISAREELAELARVPRDIDDVPLLGRGRLPLWSEPWSRETLGAVKDFVAQQGELLARLDAIHDLPRGRFPINLTVNPLDIHLPYLVPVRVAAQLETLAALRDAADGNVEAALARCRTIINMGAPLRNDPLLLSSLVSISVEVLAVADTERVLAAGIVESRQLLALQELLEECERKDGFANGLRGERLFQMATYQFLRKNGLQGITTTGGNQLETLPRGFGPLLAGFIKLNEAKALEILGSLIDALGSPRKGIDAASIMDETLHTLSARYLLVKTLMPSFSRAVTLWARHIAMLRCARAALAAERFRLETERWPESLGELVPDYLEAVPLDPFDEKPLRYKIESDKITIYSIGDNETDDGGQLVDPELPKADPPDGGFRLLNPELRGFKISEAQ